MKFDVAKYWRIGVAIKITEFRTKIFAIGPTNTQIEI